MKQSGHRVAESYISRIETLLVWHFACVGEVTRAHENLSREKCKQIVAGVFSTQDVVAPCVPPICAK